MSAIDDGAMGPEAANRISVLLVDDQLLVAEAIRRALLSEPTIDFHYCGNPADVLAAVAKFRPTVILQDLVMPGANGLDLLQQYQANPATRDIPVIVLSTKEEATVKSDAFKAGAHDYLVKLPDQIELIARIRYHSLAYLAQLERDDAYRALRESERKLRETNLELQRLTNVDGLTGLSNRRYFDSYLAAEWRRASRSRVPLALLMIDVDHFKLYNDNYGHVAGDEVLRQVAMAAKLCFQRSTDLPARYGGEEFAVILPETPLEVLKSLGEKLVESVAALQIAHSGSATARHLTVSVGGAAAVPGQESGPAGLVEAADRALYAAKHGGRDRAVIAVQEIVQPSSWARL